MTFTVAIVGRPNVGKSTLFNRLVGQRLALVDPEPGVTRDRREGEARLLDLAFRVIDTAGLEEAFDESLEARMRAQTEQAVAGADLALFVIDARAGVTPLDRHFAAWLRRAPTPVLVVANKCEGRAAEAGLAEAHGLGLGAPLALSAEHALGLGDLHEAIGERLAAWQAEVAAVADGADGGDGAADGRLQLAVVGRPNVGKSTLVNRLIGEERLLTGAEAGITRDAIAVDWRYKDRAIRLIDTAGLRRRPRVVAKVEKLSVADALRAVRFAQVVVLLVDAEAPLEKQDLTIARRVVDEGRALVIAVNKWDLCRDRAGATKVLRERLERSLPQTRGLSVVPISALQGRGLERLLDAVLAAYDVWNRRVPTAALNRWLEAVTARHPPPAPGGRRIKLRYMTQPKTRPPTFALFCSRLEELPGAYLRYLENALREAFDLPGTPLRINLRKGRNPYATDADTKGRKY
jgi:GTP-binding protein